MAEAAGTALYSAFISYNHHDRALATRLQRRIEGYRLPRRVARAAGAARLKPVFRDRDELTAAPDLSTAVRDALDRSEALIVVCTPNAAASEWVGREIDYFRGRHGDARVLTALFDGTSATAFHAALSTAADGTEAHPLAADFRREGDGRLALLKLVAVLAGVRLDELVRRDAQRRLRQLALVAAGIAVAAVAAAVLIVTAMQARAAAERERARGVDAVGFQLTDLRRRMEGAGRLDLLAAINGGVARYYAGRDPATLTTPELLHLAELKQKDAGDKEKAGETRAALKDTADALKISGAELVAHPDDPQVIFTHAQSEYWAGFIAWRLGEIGAAEASFHRYAALADKLAGVARALPPANPDKWAWQTEAGYANSVLGNLVVRETGDLARARHFFALAQGVFVGVSKANPSDADLRFEIADGEAWLADIDRLGGDYDAALAHRHAQRRIIDALLAAAPGDARYRVGLIANTQAMARIAAAQRDFAGALRQLDAAHAAAADLARIDPRNKSVARQMRVIELFKAQTWLAMPAPRHPAPAVIAQAIGDCDPEWSKPDNDELAAFCALLSADAALARGDRAAAATAMSDARLDKTATSTALSERWHLPLGAEIRRMRTLHGVS